MTTTTTPGTGLFIAQGVELLLGYADGLLADIPAERSHEIPAEGMTHPAHYIGHLAIYPDRVLDILPTACELAGTPLPDRPLDGMSLVSLLTTGQPSPRNKPLVWAYYNAINDARVAMRHGPWKVLARLNGGRFPKRTNLTPTTLKEAQSAQLTDFEIYHVPDDPGEVVNLFDRSCDQQQELIEAIRQGYTELVQDSPAWIPAGR